jgi:imidazole glycerol-phosphate synthase subunit HisH
VIVIVSYGMGNSGSIINILRKIGLEAVVSSDAAVISRASKLILPGVGAFDEGMKNLTESGLRVVIDRLVLDERIPILGICLGMQLMTKRSEEGQLAGLGWFNAEAKRFRFGAAQGNLKIPHMGWNTVHICKESALFHGLPEQIRFYFIHSFHTVCEDAEDILTKTSHGYDFPSAILRDNILGVQFHPEKSHNFGMGLLRNWGLEGRC